MRDGSGKELLGKKCLQDLLSLNIHGVLIFVHIIFVDFLLFDSGESEKRWKLGFLEKTVRMSNHW